MFAYFGSVCYGGVFWVVLGVWRRKVTIFWINFLQIPAGYIRTQVPLLTELGEIHYIFTFDLGPTI
jgi:hypothetical protein